MNIEILEQEIAKIEASIDEYDEVDTMVMADSIEAIEGAGYGEEAIVPLLHLLERHPAAYFGDPGEIVHFIEGFYRELGEKYEEYLLDSVKRTPTATTVWMINRCMNAGDEEENEKFMDALEEVLNRTDVDDYVKERARDYMEYQENR